MSKSSQKGKRSGVVRAIRSERDYRGAANVVKKLGGRTDLESASEKRLLALIKEMDKFEEPGDEDASDFMDQDEYGGPLRRWSDDGMNND